MMRRRPRHLTEDERALWQRATKDDMPLNPGRPRPIADMPVTLQEKPVKPPLRLDPFRIGAQSGQTAMGHDLAGPLADQLSRAPIRMDTKQFGRLKKGKLTPEARIDLHGMTLSAAHPALTRFILSAHARGQRLVLVITGKGKDRDDEGPMPNRRGVLRHQVPHWLHAAPLSGSVLQVLPAHLRHGGDGAYYVFLRRSR